MWIMNNIIIQKWFKIKIQFDHIHLDFSALKKLVTLILGPYIFTCAMSKSRMISMHGRYNAIKFLFICNFPRTTLSKKNMSKSVYDVMMTSSWPNLSRIYHTLKDQWEYFDLVFGSKLSRDHFRYLSRDNLRQDFVLDRLRMKGPIDIRRV